MPALYENRPVSGVHINACIKCCSKEITLWDCGYSSFNPGGGKCRDCGREVEVGDVIFPTAKSLAKIWNAQNDLPARLKVVEKEIAALEEEKAKLQRLELAWKNPTYKPGTTVG